VFVIGLNLFMADLQAQRQAVGLTRSRRRPIVAALALALLAFGYVWLERELILQNLAVWWIVSDASTKADAIVVLGGSIDVRPFAAADLYKRGFAAAILVSNTALQKAEGLGLVPSHTELNREVLLNLGIPATAITIVGKDITSTHDEAEVVRAWALKSRAKRIIVPTELFATRRTRWVFDRELSPIGVQVIVHAYPATDYTFATWWRHRYGLIDFNNEVLKYIYYRATY
jgi:uncharacterized SAM-binding protein YcdF (DUF218 family)